MNNWLDRLRISLALDRTRSGRCECRDTQATQSTAGGTGEHSDDFEALHRALLAQPRSPSTPPPLLHRSIMDAVRASRGLRAAGGRPMRFSWRWLPAPAAGIALMVGAFCWLREPAPKLPPSVTAAAAESLPKIAAVMHHGSELTQTLPASALTPLADEWERVRRDLTNSAQTALASLPVLF
jgi:hypothetical protein